MNTTYGMGRLLVLIAMALLPVLLPGCAATATHESTGQYIDDAAITTKVKAALVKAPEVSATAITVETYKGNVQLSGFVDDEAQRARAAAVAGSIKGVQRVTNDLQIKSQVRS